ncbi:hypothetical protein TNCV_255581 [Trichonephila clavipes]|nr:hypothetical protein TNCV_255581 [Trichonephila clavipes]
MLDHLEDNIRRVFADIRPQMLEKVIENWTSRLDYIRASHGSHMPEIIFKMQYEHKKGGGKNPLSKCDWKYGKATKKIKSITTVSPKARHNLIFPPQQLKFEGSKDIQLVQETANQKFVDCLHQLVRTVALETVNRDSSGRPFEESYVPWNKLVNRCCDTPSTGAIEDLRSVFLHLLRYIIYYLCYNTLLPLPGCILKLPVASNFVNLFVGP